MGADACCWKAGAKRPKAAADAVSRPMASRTGEAGRCAGAWCWAKASAGLAAAETCLPLPGLLRPAQHDSLIKCACGQINTCRRETSFTVF